MPKISATMRLLVALSAISLGLPLGIAYEKKPLERNPRKPVRIRRGSRLEPPPFTTQGRFAGTWHRIAPGVQQAIEIRQDEKGEWQVRLYWRSGPDFLLDTNWEPHHQLNLHGNPASIDIVIDQKRSTPDKLIGRYHLEAVGERDSKMVEDGELEIFRGLNGRQLAWNVDPLERVITVADALYPDEVEHETTTRKLWIFVKTAERLLEWDEIPW